MKPLKFTRCQVITTTSAGAAGAFLNLTFPSFLKSSFQDKPAILVGSKIRSKGWPEWPVWDTDRSAYHFYPFRFFEEKFGIIKKETFIRALNAEGIPCSSGYGPQNREPIK